MTANSRARLTKLERRRGGVCEWFNPVVIVCEGESNEQAIRRAFGAAAPPTGATIFLISDNGRE
jgi:hypothetical protein